MPLRSAYPLWLLFVFLGVGSFSCAQEVERSNREAQRDESNLIEIQNIRLFTSHAVGGKNHPVEIQEFRETSKMLLFPSDRFDVMCDVVGGPQLAGDYFLWTTVDFLVAPVRRTYQQMNNKDLGSSVGWGQVTEMRDLRATPIYALRPDEMRRLVVKDFHLGAVHKAFPAGDAGDLWPWLVRVTVHVQDREGRQVAVAERILRLSPSPARKTSHYDDSPPDR